MPLHGCLSRRKFLALATMSAAGGLLAACGGSTAPPNSPSAAALAKPAASTAPAGSTSAAAPAKPAASAAAAAKPSPAAQGGEPSIKVAFPVITGAQTPLWVAETLGFFGQQHVKESSQLIAGNISAKALIAKEIDVLLQAAAAPLTADLNGGADFVYVASEYNHSQESLMVAPSIKTAADLRGKVGGTDQPGSTSDYQTRLFMRLLGVQPSDVELRVLGSQDILYPALLSGQIQAAPISPPAVFQAQAAGFHSLRDSYDQPYQNVGVVVSKARIPELTPALLAFMKGYRQGMQAYAQQPEVAKKVLQDRAKISDQATLDKSYDFYVKQTPFELDMEPTPEGIQHMLDFLSTTIPAAKSAKPEQFIDRRLLDQLQLPKQ